MRTRTRVALLAAGVTLGAVAVAAALPSGSPATFLAPPIDAAAGDDTPASAGAASSAASASSTAASPPKGALPAGAAIRELRQSGTMIVVSPQGTVTAATAAPGKALATGGADAFARRYAAAFGLTDAHALAKSTVETLPGGDTVTRYEQTAGGLPVLGGQILITTRGKQVRAAIGEATSLKPAGTTAKVDSPAATAAAVTAAAAEVGIDAAGLRGGDADLVLYDPTLVGAPGAANLRPTWRVEISDANGGEVATVLVDALDGAVRLTMAERQAVRDRIVCDLANTKIDLTVSTAYQCTATSPLGAQATTRHEGGAASGVDEVNKAYEMLGATYDFYQANFGVDSFDNRGAQIRATVRACYVYDTCPYRNAFWEGTQFVFGTGFAVDDVVAHEYTHAVTEWSSHLMYAYQAGAINEAFSDIMGEFVDQGYVAAGEASPALTWQLGEDLPGGALRSMDSPNAYAQPSCVGCTYWYKGTNDSGGVHTNSGPANYAAYLIAAGGASGAGPIGSDKSEQLWWRVMHLLPSGADYSTLGAALTSACTQLIGYRGFVAADCAVVKNTVIRTGMTAAGQSIGTTGITRVNFCDASTAQPLDTLYYDGFEKPGTWPRTNSYYWLNIPSGEAPYQYAFTGVGSLNGWSPASGGNGSTATMPISVAVPATGSSYLHFSESTLSPSSSAGIYLEMSVNGGAWTAPGNLVYDGGYSLASGLLPQLKGYSDHRVNLTPLAGKQVKFRFRLSNAANTKLFDWYVDDFRVYQCAQRPSAPTGYAYLAGTTANVGGLATAYVPAGQTLDHYELSYWPAIPTAPATITATSFTVDNVAPYNYVVKVRAVTNTGATGDWTVLRMSGTPPLSCQVSAYPVWTWGARMPGLCTSRTAPPRR